MNNRKLLAAVCIAVTAWMIWDSPAAFAATLTVNTTDDLDDGSCDLTHCSLREAINSANTTTELDHITFDIPGAGPHTITPITVLPTVTSPATIDATTQPGYTNTPIIEIDGSTAGSNTTGLHITAGDTTIRGLAVHSFDVGVRFQGATSNQLQASYIGTDASAVVLPGVQDGVLIEESAANLIGGTSSGDGNLLLGFPALQVVGTGSVGNMIQGNLVGTDPTGTHRFNTAGSNIHGIRIVDGSSNLIGGPSSSARNVMTSSASISVEIEGASAFGNRVTNNHFGVADDGETFLGGSEGVRVTEASNTVIGAPGQGNVFVGFTGVHIAGSTATNTIIQSNLFGSNASGNTVLGINQGIRLRDDASHTLIGGTTAAEGNLFVGAVSGAVVGEAHDLRIENNLFGTDLAGKLMLGNHEGMRLFDMHGHNTIRNNVVAGSAATGIALNRASGSGMENCVETAVNQIVGNKIGTDITGTVALPNGIGIRIASNNATIGGPGSDRNLISGNQLSGISLFPCVNLPGTAKIRVMNNLIGTDITGSAPLGNGAGIDLDGSHRDTIIGGVGVGNVISANVGAGIPAQAASGTRVIANLIGVGIDGTTALGNGSWGMSFRGPGGTDDLVIGGPTSEEGNVVSNNGFGSVGLQGGIAVAATTNVRIMHNKVGTDITGTIAMGNAGRGIAGFGSNFDGVVVDNLVSDNGRDGIEWTGDRALIAGNLVGTDITGTVAMGNGLEAALGSVFNHQGVSLFGADGLIGGSSPEDRNIVSGNFGHGIEVAGNSPRTRIVGNYVGTDITGSQPLGNAGFGVRLRTTSFDEGVVVGGLAVGEGNVISSNESGGINVVQAREPRHVIQGNMIGIGTSGTALGNQGPGVLLRGDHDLVQRNMIAHNQADGVQIANTARLAGNTVSENSIWSNSGLGINLSTDGVTLNDVGDSDVGPNGLQNFPVAESAISDGVSTRLVGFLSSSPDGSFTLEFFANDSVGCDPSGFGEGERFLGSTVVSTGADGVAGFDVTLGVGVGESDQVTATATDTAGSTSEFSECTLVGAAPQGADLSVVKADSADPISEGDQLEYVVEVSNHGPGNATSVQMTDSLPVGAELVSVSSDTGTCSHSEGVLTCLLGDIPSGDLVTVTLVIVAPKPGILTNAATVSSDTEDPDPTNNTATETTTVADLLPSLEVIKTADPGSVPETGGEVTYTLTVTNTSAETDPVLISSLVDEVWYDLDGDGLQDPGEVTTLDPTDPTQVNSTDCVLPQTLGGDGGVYSCSFTVTVAGNPWTDPVDTVTAIGTDDEGNQAIAAGSGQVDVTQVFRRSVDIEDDDLQYSLPNSERLEGSLHVVNGSDDEIVDVLITQLDLLVEYREQTRDAEWGDAGAICSLDPKVPVILVDELTFHFDCTLTTPAPEGAELRVTATLWIHGRDKNFTVRASTG